MPFTLIGASVGQVFFKEVSDVKNTNGEATKLVWEIVKKMGLISLLGFSLLFFIAEDLFAFVFGEAWRMSGLYAKYLLPLFMIKFIVSPLIVIHNVYEELKSSFLLQLLMISLSIAIILIAYIIDLNFDNFLILFSSVMSLFYLIRFIIILKIAKE
jgi:O-antigen/teichoic acid export membrane protein